MPEAAITPEDVERMLRGVELFNGADFDALQDFFAPDVIVQRIGGMPPIQGWAEVRTFFEPDAFESQRIEPLDWEINGDKALIHMRIHSVGAGSGLKLANEGWMVWTVVDHRVTRIESFGPAEGAEARAAAGLGQNDSL